MSLSTPEHVRLYAAWLALAALSMVLACSRPTDRPLEGAQPLRPGNTSAVGTGEPPPTLAVPAPPTSLPLPIVLPAPSPSASPSPNPLLRNPILSGLSPAPQARVPPGNVNIAARVAGSTDLAEVTLLVNGTAVQPRVTTQDAKIWLVSYAQRFDTGEQEVRIRATDRDGRAGGYRWRFEVGAVDPSPKPGP